MIYREASWRVKTKRIKDVPSSNVTSCGPADFGGGEFRDSIANGSTLFSQPKAVESQINLLTEGKEGDRPRREELEPWIPIGSPPPASM